MPANELPTCVFCGQPIEPEQEAAGRSPMAAHARCADAALADDAHWDRIDSEAADAQPAAEPPSGRPAARASGCLVVAMLALAVILPLILG